MAYASRWISVQDGTVEAWWQELEAESPYLEPQAGSIEEELEMV